MDNEKVGNDKLTDAVLERAVEAGGEKKLRCPQAFELARELNVAVVEIGRICDQQDVRICQCQLGCFA